MRAEAAVDYEEPRREPGKACRRHILIDPRRDVGDVAGGDRFAVGARRRSSRHRISSAEAGGCGAKEIGRSGQSTDFPEFCLRIPATNSSARDTNRLSNGDVFDLL